MKEITSKKTGHMQIISEKVWEWICNRRMQNKYKVRDIPEKKLKEVPIITKSNKSGKKD